MRDADQIHLGKFRTGPLIRVVIEHVAPRSAQLCIQFFAGRIRRRITGLQIHNRNIEWRHRFGPDDTGIIMAGFDDRAHQSRHAHAIGPAMNGHILAVGTGHAGLHRHRIFVTEIKHLPHFDAARAQPLGLRHFGLEPRLFMDVFGSRIEIRPFTDDRFQIILCIHIFARYGHINQIFVQIDLALARLGQHNEFMGKITTNRPGFGAHRNCLQPHAREQAQIRDIHPVIGFARRLLVHVKGIGILHQKFAATHHAKTRTHLVAEFPLDVIKVQRQRLVGFHIGTENFRHHVFVGRPI